VYYVFRHIECGDYMKDNDDYKDPWTGETWRTSFAWFPTRVGTREDRTHVRVWLKSYEVAGKDWRSYGKFRRPLPKQNNVEPYCVWWGR